MKEKYSDKCHIIIVIDSIDLFEAEEDGGDEEPLSWLPK